MLNNSYRIALELLRSDGTHLVQEWISPDFQAAHEWTRFLGVRRGRIEPGAAPDAFLEPVWHGRRGEPYLESFRIVIPANGSPEDESHTPPGGMRGYPGEIHHRPGDVVGEFQTTLLGQAAVRISTNLVERGELREGERFRYLALAFLQPDCGNDRAAPRFAAREVAPSIPLKETPLESYLVMAQPLVGESHPIDMPVFFAPRIFEEAVALSREAGELETGGVLIGHLHRDSSIPEIFVEVTEQLPARHTRADSTSLTFTAQTWTEIKASLAIRAESEIIVGWWHRHPVKEWCRNCPAENQRVCKLRAGFFSTHDEALHRAIFPRAYSIALVINDAGPSDSSYSVFGWRHGEIEGRGFHVACAPAEGHAGRAGMTPAESKRTWSPMPQADQNGAPAPEGGRVEHDRTPEGNIAIECRLRGGAEAERGKHAQRQGPGEKDGAQTAADRT